MYQRDYLMRMIEQVTDVLGQVMGLRRRKEHHEAQRVIDDLFDRRFRLNGRLVQSLSAKDLAAMLTVNGTTDTASLEAVARLVKEHGDIEDELGNEGARYARYCKALDLYLHLAVAARETRLGDAREAVRELLALLSPYELPPETKRLLAGWHEHEGRYAEAENWLHEYLEDAEEGRDEAEAFYRRLLLLDDARLEAGGLTREEAETGLAELNRQGV